MDLLANYNDDSLNLEDSPSTFNEKEESRVEDKSLEDEWLSFEKMISAGESSTENGGSSRYLVHGMVAYPGMSLGQRTSTSGPDNKEAEKEGSSDEDDNGYADKNTKAGPSDDEDDDDAFFKMRKKVKERDRSSSSDRSSQSSRSSGSLSPPLLSPVDSVTSQHSLPPPELFDPTEDMHHKSPEMIPQKSPERSPEGTPENPETEKLYKQDEVTEDQTEQDVVVPSQENEVREQSLSEEHKPSKSREGRRKDSHRSRSRSKHRESRKHRSRSRSKGRRRHSSKDRHRHRKPRHRSRDRKGSHSKEKKRSKSRERKSDDKSSKNKERRSKSKERSRGKDRRKSEKDRKRSRSKERRRSKSKERRRDRSGDRKRRHSKSRSKSRDRKRNYSRSRSRERLRSRSPILGKKMTFKERMRKELLSAGKRADKESVASESSSTPINSPGEILKASAVLASIKSTSSAVTPQMALLQTMAAMHQKAQEITGVAVPKYYNPAAVNPLKYAEQVQKRKLLWSKNKQDDKEKEKEVQMESQWKSTQFAADQDGKMTSKFRKLMGIKDGAENEEDIQSELSEEQKRKQDELFSRLDKEYEFARMATHTHRGVGLGFSSQVQFPSTQPPH